MAQEKTVTYYQDPASTPPDLPVKLKHILAQVTFEPEQNLVKADVQFTLVPNRYSVDSIVFYAPEFNIKKIVLETKSAGGSKKLTGDNMQKAEKSEGDVQYISPAQIGISYKQRRANLIILPEPGRLEKGKEYQLSISYEAIPLTGAIYFTGWSEIEKGKRKTIWAHRPHGWLPYIDSRITMDMYFTFDSRYRIFANGERMGVTEHPDGTSTWHYCMSKDHPSFSTSLVIGEYDFETIQTTRGIPLEYWYYDGMKDRVPVTYKYTPQMFDFFEQEMGVNYPYPVYRQAPVIDYMYGGMETTTATVFGDYMLIDPHAWWQRNYVNVNAHELAHQWFGNYVAHFVNRDVWLTESFGTYYAKLFERHVYGEDYYQNLKNEEMLLAFDAAKRNHYPVGGCQGGVQRIYQKGSLVLDMLRNVMGERSFRDAIRLYLQRYGFGYAETNDFIRCTYDVTGQSWNWFFDQWILRGGEPHYRVRYEQLKNITGTCFTNIRAEQIQEMNELMGTFRMPIDFHVYYVDKSYDSLTAWIDKSFTEVRIPNKSGKKVSFVLFDPGRNVLKKVTFERTYDELAAQAQDAHQMIDRYDALLGLRIFPVDTKRDLLISCYRNERFHLTKAEIIYQLSGDTAETTVNLFRGAMQDPDALVRKAVLQYVFPVPPTLENEMKSCLRDSSYQNIELALEHLCRSFPEHDSLFLAITDTMTGWRGKNIRMKWLEIAIMNGKDTFLQELIGYTSPEFEFETRMNAFGLLKKIRYIDETTLFNARLAAKHWNNKLSAVGKEYLSYFGEN
jgi:aminopeptidase N